MPVGFASITTILSTHPVVVIIVTIGDMDHDRSSELPNRSNELFIIQLVFLIIAGICTLIRAYIKIFLVKCVTTDDSLILSAMVIFPFFTFY